MFNWFPKKEAFVVVAYRDCNIVLQYYFVVLIISKRAGMVHFRAPIGTLVYLLIELQQSCKHILLATNAHIHGKLQTLRACTMN